MATNPFAKFVQPQENPFARFAEPQRQDVQEQRTPQPQQEQTPPGQIPGAGPYVAPPAQPTQLSTGRRVASRAIDVVRPSVEALGAIGGAAVGTVGATPGLGTVVGGGLGYGAAKTGLDFLQQQLGTQRAPESVGEALLTGARDVTVGAAFEAGGRAAAPVIARGLESFGRGALKALNVLPNANKQAINIARNAAGKDIEAIRAALKNAQAGETPAQATAGIPRKAWQALTDLGRSSDQMDQILANQMDDILGSLARMARGGNDTEIREALEASRSMLNAVTSPMRNTELAAANQAAETIARLGPRAAQRETAMISALRQGQPMPVPAQPVERTVADLYGRVPGQGLVQGSVPGTPLPGQSMVVPSVEAAQRMSAAQAQLQRVVPGQIPQVSATQAARTQAAAANQWQETADIFANIARQRRAELGFIERQIGSLEAYGLRPLQIGGITKVIDDAMNTPGLRASQINQQVLSRVRNQLTQSAQANGGIIDARDLYTIRKEGVNEIIEELTRGADPKVSRQVASKVLSIVRPTIDRAIKEAGGTGWDDYMRTFSDGAKQLEKQQMAGELVRMFRDSPSEYVRLVKGNNKEAVEAIFGHGNFSIFKEMAQEMPTLNAARNYVERQAKMGQMATEGREELARIINESTWKRRLPGWFSPAITAANLGLRQYQARLSDKSLEIIRNAATSNQSMLELLGELPPAERRKLMRLVNNLGKAIDTPTARGAATATFAPDQQQMAQEQP